MWYLFSLVFVFLFLFGYFLGISYNPLYVVLSDSSFVGTCTLLGVGIMHCSRDSSLSNLYFGCTLQGVGIMRCSHDSNLPDLYFDEDTLICTLVSVRWLYFDEDTQICTLDVMRCSHDSISLDCALGESILMGTGEGMLGFTPSIKHEYCI